MTVSGSTPVAWQAPQDDTETEGRVQWRRRSLLLLGGLAGPIVVGAWLDVSLVGHFWSDPPGIIYSGMALAAIWSLIPSIVVGIAAAQAAPRTRRGRGPLALALGSAGIGVGIALFLGAALLLIVSEVRACYDLQGSLMGTMCETVLGVALLGFALPLLWIAATICAIGYIELMRVIVVRAAPTRRLFAILSVVAVIELGGAAILGQLAPAK